MNFSESEENYIKAIYHLQQPASVVTTNELAAVLQAKPASVTDMLKRLNGKKLVNYEPYQGFSLSAAGKKAALTVVRKHRLWEYFLVNKLNLRWDEVHEIAEQLEHINSALLIEKLDTFLNFPKFDPHGDPIPDVNGRMERSEQINLTDLELHVKSEVTAVGSQSTQLLELLTHKNIGIGTVITVIKKFPFDNSMEVRIKKQSSFAMSQQLAQALFVKPLYGKATRRIAK